MASALFDTAFHQILIVLIAVGMLGLAYHRGVHIRWRKVSGTPQTPEQAVDRINALLPQTQCGKCGYGGCLPYARAINEGIAINKCPPGGPETIRSLAALLRRPVVEPDPVHGRYEPPRVAVIREAECIGCTKCIQVCPLDAIVGATRQMHTVIASECSGCELCLAPCPVDCIDLVALPARSGHSWPLPMPPVPGSMPYPGRRA